MPIEMTLKKAIIGFAIPFAILLALVLCGADIYLSLIIAITALVIFGLVNGAKWKDMEKAALEGASSVLGAVVVIMLVGTLIGIWIACGSVPAMLYYGLKVISPKFFLPIAFALCCITSMATGTCWGTAGTIGVALIGVATGLGVSLPMAAGAIISGALFGDKLSPLSDTTLISSSCAGSNLYDHIVSMLFDTLPVTVICLAAYTILGLQHAPASDGVIAEVTTLTEGLYGNFNISPLMLVPPLITIVLSLRRVPPMIVFAVSIILGAVWGMIFQGISFQYISSIAFNGFTSNTGIDIIDSLLSRGGTVSMATSTYIALTTSIFGRLLYSLNILSTIMMALRKVIRSGRWLVIATNFTCLFLMIGGASQYATLTLPGFVFKDAYEDYDIHPSVLSRTMENSGTLVGSIIPWDVCAIFLSSTLGVPIKAYLPFAFLPMLSPVIGLINGFCGFGIFHKDEKVRLTWKPRKYERIA